MPPDYSGQNLSGRSFKGQNLADANFSHTDIRSTNFTGANLRRANFTGAKAGSQKRWILLLVVLFLLLLVISGLYNVPLISFIFNSSRSLHGSVAGWVTLIVTIIVYIILIHRGMSVSPAFAFFFVSAGAGAFAFAVAGAGAFGLVLTGAFTIASTYVGWRAIKGDEKYALVWNLAVAFAAIGGTSFRGADLTDANFTKARLKSTDFRTAKLIRTCFEKTKSLEVVCPGTSYLQYFQVRQLILTGQGQNKNFNRLDLRGINLKSAFLTDASFIGTDLSEACLQDADLSRAKLVQTQLDNTDFTGATLTGAIIEDWNITHETNFRNVRCEYVYMRLPTKENRNPLRKPDNNDEVFTDGDFADFIQPIFDTLDLYHNQGVDPRAIAISFKELAEKNPDAELEIVAMEKRGDDKFLLRTKTAPSADKSQLSGQYFETYNQIKSLPESQVKLLLAEKDNHISRLENMVMTTLERPSFYSNTQVGNLHNMNNNPGGTSQNMSGGTMYGGMQAAGDNSNQQMETNVTQPDEKQLTQADVIQMLAQIEQLINSTPELPQADKEKSLRYLGAAKEETQASETG